ncbi:MAG: hypothetical protein DMG26_02255 [Acidobacteria bacterium]|nr:MAG: hypothetical protein DMG26_02255 [Acidobacteriota bacterium]
MFSGNWCTVETESRQPKDLAPPQLKAAICKEASTECEKRFGQILEAVVLAGSLARDEGTFVGKGQDRWSALGDAEFLLVFQRNSPLPGRAVLKNLEEEIEGLLEAQNVTCPVRLNALHPAHLWNLRPTMDSFELRSCGQVIWGDEAILSLIPDFSPRDIPLEDAWHLLSKRMVKQLAVADQLVEWASPSTEAHYQTVKLYLDMAASFLMFSGAYAPTCRERSKRLSVLARNARSVDEYPFPLFDFASHIEACTRWKLSPDEDPPTATRSHWDTAVVYAWLLWRWELARLTGADHRLGNFELIERWFEREPLRDRWRGWRVVVRKCGWPGSRHWPRWARLLRQASPQLWIYAAGSELLFSLPSLSTSCGRLAPDAKWNRVRDWLPVGQHDLTNQRARWRALASEIVRNYQEFVAETRLPLGSSDAKSPSLLRETQREAIPRMVDQEA